MSIGPGEIKEVVVRIQSDTTVPSNVTLSLDKDKYATFNATITPKTLSLSSNGSASATMTIVGSLGSIWNKVSALRFLHLDANMSLPQVIRLPDISGPGHIAGISIKTPIKPIHSRAELMITESNLATYMLDM